MAALLKDELLVPGECVGFVGEDFDETRFNLFFFFFNISFLWEAGLPLLAVLGYHFRVIKKQLNCSWNLSLKNSYKDLMIETVFWWQYYKTDFIGKATMTINYVLSNETPQGISNSA